MGEVGAASAAETTTPMVSSELKENGEMVNGAVDAAGPAVVTAAAADAGEKHTASPKKATPSEGEEKFTAVSEPDDDDDDDVVAAVERDSTGDSGKVAPEVVLKKKDENSSIDSKEKRTTSPGVRDTQTVPAEKKTENSDSMAEPAATEKLNKSDSSVVRQAAKCDNDVHSKSENAMSSEKKRSNSGTENGKSAAQPNMEIDAQAKEDSDSDLVEAMELDDDDSGEEPGKEKFTARAPHNGEDKQSAGEEEAEEGEGEEEDEGEGVLSQETQTKVSALASSEAKSTDDEEPMEVDGASEESAATNGHNELVDGINEGAKQQPVSSTVTNKEKSSGRKTQTPVRVLPPAEEEDDDKPVSINSDSDSDEPQRGVPTQAALKPKPPPNVIVVDEGGLAKLGEGGKHNRATTTVMEKLQVGNGETTISVATAKTSNSNPSSNGVVALPVATGNQNGNCDGDVTILSDKEEDCVVIEDDDGDSDASTPTRTVHMAAASASSRRSIRSKRSGGSVPVVTGGTNPLSLVMQQQQKQQGLLTPMDDDDDIEEIIDDPLSATMAMGKIGVPGAPLGRSPMGGHFQGGAASLKGAPHKPLLMNSSGAPATGGKEPTLVIIDTNTLMNNSSNTRTPTSLLGQTPVGNSGSSLLGKAHGNATAGMLGNMGNNSLLGVGQFNSRSLLNPTGVLNSTSGGSIISGGTVGMLGKASPSPLTPVTPLLPALTDDMFVLEAPSFIVPYIYEKPPVDNLRGILDELETEIKEMRKKLEESGAVLTADKSSAQPQETGTSSEQQQGKDGEASRKEADSADTEKESDSKKRKRNTDDDDEWDELDTSTDDEASDEEQKTKVLIKEARADIEAIKEHIISPLDKDDLGGGGGSSGDPKKQSENYFENPLGKFFMNIGINQVQEFVQTDLLRQQKRKRDREGKPSPSTQMAINSLMKNLEQSKENNKPYKFEMKRCEYCPFKSESALVMAHHYETPHMRNFIYKCNFCSYETRPPHDILYHMEAVHNIKGRMEKALSYHHCPNCPFEDNGKSKLARHAVACAKKFRPEINLNPPLDWEPPAKIPRIKPKHGLVGTATAYQAMTAQQQKNLALANQQRLNQQQNVTPVSLQTTHLTHQQMQQQQATAAAAAGMNLSGLSGNTVGALNSVNLANLSPAAQAVAIRSRAGVGNVTVASGMGGRAPAIISSPTGITGTAAGLRTAPGTGVVGTGAGAMSANALAASAAAIRNTLAGAGMVIPNNLQLSASALAAAAAGGFNKFMPNPLNAGRSLLSNSNASITIQNASSIKTTKAAQPPSISITPLPRQSASAKNATNMSNIAGALSKLQAQGTSAVKPGQNPAGGKTAFVVCEICDGYIKDLDQLRNHMQWIHKVKIHPKMIYNRPPLNCQKCQYRFFTDQGLERHLLGSHGLVTSSMQEAANKGKDAGRCPVCGRVYQWQLLNHVSRDHNMTLKPAHLSYKCTVCTATFGMYKQFESHVYSAHSTVAKKTVDSKGKGGGGGQQGATNMGAGATSSSGGLRSSAFGTGNDSLLKPLKINDEITIIPQPTSNSSKMAKTIELESHVID